MALGRSLAAIAACALVAGITAAQTPAHDEAMSYLIQTSAKFQRLGPWRIDRAATLQGAIEALGDPSRCSASGNHAVATWSALGVVVDLWTYGAITPGENGCTAPDEIQVNFVRVTNRRWYTSLGLRVGDSMIRLHRLYPRAQKNPRGNWPRPNAYWLVTRRTVCLGDCGAQRYVSVPQLLAEVQGSRVAAFFFHVGAQGE